MAHSRLRGSRGPAAAAAAATAAVAPTALTLNMPVEQPYSHPPVTAAATTAAASASASEWVDAAADMVAKVSLGEASSAKQPKPPKTKSASEHRLARVRVSSAMRRSGSGRNTETGHRESESRARAATDRRRGTVSHGGLWEPTSGANKNSLTMTTMLRGSARRSGDSSRRSGGGGGQHHLLPLLVDPTPFEGLHSVAPMCSTAAGAPGIPCTITLATSMSSYATKARASGGLSSVEPQPLSVTPTTSTSPPQQQQTPPRASRGTPSLKVGYRPMRMSKFEVKLPA